MTERPILMQGDMVRATLLDLKDQTRRDAGLGIVNESPSNWRVLDIGISEDGKLQVSFISVSCPAVTAVVKCPYGIAGNILWVRETFAKVAHSSYRQSNGVLQMPIDEHYVAVFKAGWDRSQPTWKPSIHMPKKATRLWLQINSITVERLQSISDEDAICEGITLPTLYTHEVGPKEMFENLWVKIYGSQSWTKNPWLWVIKYKVLSKTGKPNF